MYHWLHWSVCRLPCAVCFMQIPARKYFKIEQRYLWRALIKRNANTFLCSSYCYCYCCCHWYWCWLPLIGFWNRWNPLSRRCEMIPVRFVWIELPLPISVCLNHLFFRLNPHTCSYFIYNTQDIEVTKIIWITSPTDKRLRDAKKIKHTKDVIKGTIQDTKCKKDRKKFRQKSFCPTLFCLFTICYRQRSIICI